MFFMESDGAEDRDLHFFGDESKNLQQDLLNGPQQKTRVSNSSIATCLVRGPLGFGPILIFDGLKIFIALDPKTMKNEGLKPSIYGL